jgi:glutamine amidotransferase
MMMDYSDENGGVQGLGVVPGHVARFPEDLKDQAEGIRLKVPHMGWNRVRQTRQHPLWAGIGQDSWFYFVHSYHLCPQLDTDVVGSTNYGIEFTSALARSNVFAVQFHPEKSARDGLRLLANFVAWSPT